ncbi:glutamine ABC transporter permease [Halomonas cupida]|uniref:Glutamate/aspartate import permease protein GltK n=1 Tax=Halomonas cupida TaxID=44933 RepID=A0A1M7C949_9GAMM|nr:amino acid ABC transporter permease [Halomonas cupida]GEN25149.1 glutamine ABC transporter permease [Halomonas cupida]SHL63802.1 polar amino acid transport system permease protein [Halomonas cupida]
MLDFLRFGIEWLPALLKGVPLTLALWVIAITLGCLLGLILCWARVYGNRLCYWISTVYIELFRGTPMLVQMFFIYLGLPHVGIVFDAFTAAVIAITLNSAAYQAEYFRGSVLSVPRGQMVAARACGMSKWQAIRHIMLPQALRRVIPQWSNEAIIELKFTSIAYTIGVVEITAIAQDIGSRTLDFFQVFLWAGLIYLVLTSTVASLLSWVERRTHVPGVTTN